MRKLTTGMKDRFKDAKTQFLSNTDRKQAISELEEFINGFVKETKEGQANILSPYVAAGKRIQEVLQSKTNDKKDFWIREIFTCLDICIKTNTKFKFTEEVQLTPKDSDRDNDDEVIPSDANGQEQPDSESVAGISPADSLANSVLSVREGLERMTDEDFQNIEDGVTAASQKSDNSGGEDEVPDVAAFQVPKDSAGKDDESDFVHVVRSDGQSENPSYLSSITAGLLAWLKPGAGPNVPDASQASKTSVLKK